MKKIAVLIGNSRGLPSTSKDLLDFYTYLTSPQGGAWEPTTEIISMVDKPVSEISDVLSKIRGQYQYVVIYFTGHGGTESGTILEVNPQNERLLEPEILGLSRKQINILDCCRSSVSGGVAIYESHDSITDDVRNVVRQEYDELIENSAEQQVLIYSCEEGKPSYSLPGGNSIFTKCLLDASEDMLKTTDVVRIYDVFALAAQQTALAAKKLLVEQHPEIVPAKCLSTLELPFCFNPKCLKSNNG